MCEEIRTTASTGTVGAALEANIAGIPALSLSQMLPSEIYREWYRSRSFDADTMSYFREQFEKIVPALWEAFLPNILEQEAICWNVNFPKSLAEDWELKPSFCGYSLYASCFSKNEEGYYHDAPNPKKDTRADADINVLNMGHVSVTEMDIRHFGQFQN